MLQLPDENQAPATVANTLHEEAKCFCKDVERPRTYMYLNLSSISRALSKCFTCCATVKMVPHCQFLDSEHISLWQTVLS